MMAFFPTSQALFGFLPASIRIINKSLIVFTCASPQEKMILSILHWFEIQAAVSLAEKLRQQGCWSTPGWVKRPTEKAIRKTRKTHGWGLSQGCSIVGQQHSTGSRCNRALDWVIFEPCLTQYHLQSFRNETSYECSQHLHLQEFAEFHWFMKPSLDKLIASHPTYAETCCKGILGRQSNQVQRDEPQKVSQCVTEQRRFAVPYHSSDS